MIAKRVNKAGKSNFRDLSRYVRDVKGNGEKVRDVWATNCADATDIEFVEIEIAATQDLNTRSKIDKTYHLVISLAPGEDLSNEQFREVERLFCEAIGLSEHQRVCAIHSDTSSIHMHLAISKIHLLKLTAIEPYYDKYKLQDSCRELEKRFGLVPGISEEKNKSRHQKDAFQKLQSFDSYVKDKIQSNVEYLMDQCKSWQEFQAELGRFNLEIRERGAGLVISDREKPLFIKASSIDKSFSKLNLEKIFGNFEKSQWNGKPEESYKSAPTAKTVASQTLYENYLLERGAAYGMRGEISLAQRESLKEKIDEAKERYALKRLEVKKDTLIAKGRKRLIYQKLSAHMKEELGEIIAENREETEKSKKSIPVKAWKDWIYEEASRGSESALGVLRDGMPSPRDQGVGEFRGERNHKMFQGLSRTVLKDGSVQYQLSEGSFIDSGDAIILKCLDPKVVEVAQRCAEAKFGESMKLSGASEFLAMIKSNEVPKPIKLQSKDMDFSR